MTHAPAQHVPESQLTAFFRVLESLLVTMVTTVVIFAASMLLGECHELPPSMASTVRPSGQCPAVGFYLSCVCDL